MSRLDLSIGRLLNMFSPPLLRDNNLAVALSLGFVESSVGVPVVEARDDRHEGACQRAAQELPWASTCRIECLPPNARGRTA